MRRARLERATAGLGISGVALEALTKLFNLLRGQKKGQVEGPETQLFGKTTQIKLIRFKEIWQITVSKTKRYLMENYICELTVH